MKYTANDKPAIRPERIERVRKLLQDLPERDTRISKRETVTRLESDIRKALKKGYTSKEIVALMKAEGIIVSMQLIKEVLEPENKKENAKKEAIKTHTNDTLEKEPKAEVENVTSSVSEKSTEAEKLLPTEIKESVLPNTDLNILGNVKDEKSNRAKIASKVLEKTEAKQTTTVQRAGRFEIIPDTPDDEL